MLRDQRRRLLRRLSRVGLPTADPNGPTVRRRSAASGGGGRSVLSSLRAMWAARLALLRLLPLRRGRTVALLGSGVLPAEVLAGRGAMAAARPGNGATGAAVLPADGAMGGAGLLAGVAMGMMGLLGSGAVGGKMGVGAAGVHRGRGLRRAWGR